MEQVQLAILGCLVRMPFTLGNHCFLFPKGSVSLFTCHHLCLQLTLPSVAYGCAWIGRDWGPWVPI